MTSNPYCLLKFIANIAKKHKISMGDIATQCEMSRSTLYRQLRKNADIPPAILSRVIQVIQFTPEENSDLNALLHPSDDLSVYERAFPLVDTLLHEKTFCPDVTSLLHTLNVYQGQQKEKSTFEQITKEICQKIQKENLQAHIHVVGYTPAHLFPQLIYLVSLMMSVSNEVTVEQLICLEKNDATDAIKTMLYALSLVCYNRYQLFYHEGKQDKTYTGIFENSISIMLSKPTEDVLSRGTQNSYYLLSCLQEGEVQCLTYHDDATYAFYMFFYHQLRTVHSKGLISFRNIAGFSKQMAEFETGGSQVLFKQDLCQNNIPVEAYHAMHKRLTIKEKLELVSGVMGRNIEPKAADAYIQNLIDQLVLRNKTTNRYPYYVLCNKQGLEYLAQTGLFIDGVVPLPAFNKKERIMIFEHLLMRVNNPNDTMKLVLVEKQLLPLDYIIEVSEQNGVLIDFGKGTIYGRSQNIHINAEMITQTLLAYAIQAYETQQKTSPNTCSNFLKGLLAGL